jgi:6-phosphogluconate dehydrogenase
MQVGVIGLGRMGSNMVRRWMRGGHQCVVFDLHADAVAALVKDGATGAASMEEFVSKLKPPRVAWMMVPAGAVDATLGDLSPRMEKEDIIIDGGNSYYIDDLRRAEELRARGIYYIDAGTSGGVWGLERGFCLMIGGDEGAVRRLDPIFKTLAPGRGDVERTPGREKAGGTAEEGYLYCGPSGAGRFVKMVHNGIEYGLMAAYAEGLNILRQANIGKQASTSDAPRRAAAAAGELPI